MVPSYQLALSDAILPDPAPALTSTMSK